MPKVLIVSDQFTYSAQYVAVLLRNLGIDYDFAIGDNPSLGLQTRLGLLTPDSTDCRNYLRQYDAVLIVRNSQSFDSGNTVRLAGAWLQWTAPEDPPKLYFGWNFSVAATGVNPYIPADFPLIRPNNADIPNTVAIADNNIIAISTFSGRPGTYPRLHRENISIYTPSICTHHTDGRIAYWRLNTDNHPTLSETPYTHRVAPNNRAGEILATPTPQPDENYPSNTVIAYRYYNNFFLPLLRAGDRIYGHTKNPPFPDAFWLLYGLKLSGVKPAWKLPIYFETDHPLDWATNRTDGTTTVEIFDACTYMSDYMRDFHFRTGMVTHHAVVTGGMARPFPTLGNNRHWQYIHATRYSWGTPEIEQAARRCHDVLLAGHRSGATPCGIHDHTLPTGEGGGFWKTLTYTGFQRHSADQYDSPYNPSGVNLPLQAPNDVRYRKGQCCVKREHSPVQPGEGDTTLIPSESGEYVEWNYPSGSMTGTAIQFNLPAGSLQAARMVIESNIAEMLAMGFPDGHGGEHGYTNCAKNSSGGPAYWQAAREYGYKALRSSYGCNAGNHYELNTIPANYIWEGFHFLPHYNIDVASASEYGGYGLYYPGVPATYHAVGSWGLDNAGDITSDYPNTARRAYRRALCYTVSSWLWANTTMLGACYVHPAANIGFNLIAPYTRFDGVLEWKPGLPHFNNIVETFEEMYLIVRVLSDYLYFGSVSDLIKIREKVMG
ncbi:MAG: hypothetical protein KatS3mg016_0861 [Fimbriimonadales bacterium]|nr:MAG: hypothetical protein KatS3mg016_0861 [Fimbriimonadales bacterium]